MVLNMIVNNVSIILSAVSKVQYPVTYFPEIAFVGRSNVGKSSLINKLVNRKAIARISSKPGKTATINFYNIEDKLLFVDLPGYGYAKVSKVEKKKWGEMIEEYLNTRQQLKNVIMLLDIRREPTEDDRKMLNWLRQFNFNTIVVATKKDKLKKSEVLQNELMIRDILKISANESLIPFSAVTGEGKDEIWAEIEKCMGVS